jgi:hypothetical protein
VKLGKIPEKISKSQKVNINEHATDIENKNVETYIEA